MKLIGIAAIAISAYTLFCPPILCAAPPAALVVEETEAPSSFELIGVYEVHSIIRVRSAQSKPVFIRGSKYKVFSNGQIVRLYQEGLSKAYHAYEIYRSDGVSEEDSNGNIAIHPGIQARLITTDLLKQLSVTQRKLTITQFPPLSDTIVITYASRVPD